MNLFKRISMVALGLGLAVGVGSSLAVQMPAKGVEAKSGDVYTFVGTSGSGDSNWSFTTAKNGGYNDPAYNTTKNELRLYPCNKISFTGKTGVVISSASFTCVMNASSKTYPTGWSASSGTITDFNTSLTAFSVTGVNANSLDVTISSGGKGNVGLKTVSLVYTGGGTETFNVTYLGNGSTGGSVPVDGNEYDNNDEVTVLGNSGELVKTGYSFDGWNTKADGTGTSYVEGGTFLITSNVNLFAKWVPNKYTYSYDLNGGSGTCPEGDTVDYHTSVTLSDGEGLSYAGKVFEGWNSQPDGSGTSYTPSQKVYIVEDITFYAKWADVVPELAITIGNFTEITASYTTVFTHRYTVEESIIGVEAFGVYKNANGIQMNTGKGTYIKNLDRMPGYITKIEIEWSAYGKNTATIYASKDEVASTSSDCLGVCDKTVKKNSFTIENAETAGYKYFYFDGTTVTGACYITKLSVQYSGTQDCFDAVEFENQFVTRPGSEHNLIAYPASTPTGVSGTACLSTTAGGQGYYDAAIEAYEELGSSVKTLFSTSDEFANARERIQAWAVANGKTVSFGSDGSLTVNSNVNGLMLGENESILLISIITVSSMVVIVGLFFIKRRKNASR